jgi:hypothetical protein
MHQRQHHLLPLTLWVYHLMQVARQAPQQPQLPWLLLLLLQSSCSPLPAHAQVHMVLLLRGHVSHHTRAKAVTPSTTRRC